MIARIAGTLALTVFAICLLAGLSAENPFSTVIVRALFAMVATLVIGLILGTMAQKMLDENVLAHKNAGKIENDEAKTNATDR